MESIRIRVRVRVRVSVRVRVRVRVRGWGLGVGVEFIAACSNRGFMASHTFVAALMITFRVRVHVRVKARFKASLDVRWPFTLILPASA